MARVVIENLGKTFIGPKGEYIPAVREATLTVADQEFVVLVGPSGCGKSTLLRLIAGLEETTTGSIAIDGEVVNDVDPRDRDIAMVFQNGALYPHLTAYENMAFGLMLRKFPKAEIERRVRDAADLLDLTSCLDRLPKALSGGQRQRVAVGRAIVRKPKVFLLDEPLSNLDAPMRVQMRTELAKLRTRLAATILYVTHDQAEGMILGDRLVVMRDGRFQQTAQPLQLYHHPVNLFVAGFIGSPPMNLVRGCLTLQAGALYFEEQNPLGPAAPGWLRAPLTANQQACLLDRAGQPIILGLRPENLTVFTAPPNATRPPLAQATVEVIEPMGAESHLYLATGAHTLVARMPAGFSIELNQKATLSFEMTRAHFFDPVSELALPSGT